MWKEEILKCETCQTVQAKQAFQHTASLKYHVKRGTKIALFQDGWTLEGRTYFSFLCQGFDALKKSNKIWSLLQDHWKTYSNKYHMMGVEECIDNNNVGKADCSDEERGNDDDCMFFLPGEETSNFKDTVELESNLEEHVESDSNSDRFWARNKRRRVGV